MTERPLDDPTYAPRARRIVSDLDAAREGAITADAAGPVLAEGVDEEPVESNRRVFVGWRHYAIVAFAAASTPSSIWPPSTDCPSATWTGDRRALPSALPARDMELPHRPRRGRAHAGLCAVLRARLPRCRRFAVDGPGPTSWAARWRSLAGYSHLHRLRLRRRHRGRHDVERHRRGHPRRRDMALRRAAARRHGLVRHRAGLGGAPRARPRRAGRHRAGAVRRSRSPPIS